MKKTNFVKLWLIIYIFCLIYAPPIFYKVNFLWLQSVFTSLLLITKYRNRFKTFISCKYIRTFLGLYMIATFYIFCIIIISFIFSPINIMNYIISLYRVLLVLGPVTICVIYIILVADSIRLSISDILKLCVFSGLIQSVITILTLSSPQVKYSIASFVLKNTSGKNISDIPFWEYQRRYFAFSDCMVDMIGIGSGILTAIAFYLGIVKKNYYFLFSAVLFLVPLFNAVTGIIITVIAILCLIPLFKKYLNGKKFVFIQVIFMLCLIGVIIFIFKQPDSIKWVMRELNALLHITQATQNNAAISSVKNIFKESFWILPSDPIILLFGSGHTLYEAQGYTHSDIGYINIIWLCGIWGSVLLYGSYIYLFYHAWKHKRFSSYRYLIIGVAFSFFAFECKGIGITYHPGMPLILLLSFIGIRNKNQAI